MLSREVKARDVFILADKKYPDCVIRLQPLPNKAAPNVGDTDRGVEPFNHIYQLHTRKKGLSFSDPLKAIDWKLECQGTLLEIEGFLNAKTSQKVSQ